MLGPEDDLSFVGADPDISVALSRERGGGGLDRLGEGAFGTRGGVVQQGHHEIAGRQEGLMSFALSAEVVRMVPQGEQMLYGVHFEALPPDVRGELVMMLRMIAAGKGAKRRAAPRVASRIVVTCGSQDSFRAVLNDLSRGGFSVRCKREMKIGELLQAKFGVEGLPGLLDLQGPVMNVTPLPDGHFRVGVKFDALPEATLSRVMHLLDVLLGLAPRNGVIIEDDE
jgi:hypothetical protein